ncbi:MAG: hypothetical protein IJ504_00965 [Bacteroidales bacterium]|nr:hypothetical protein [Bacteroidales bacterium]
MHNNPTKAVASFFFYMWNGWCEDECRTIFGNMHEHFWSKWTSLARKDIRGAVERFYAELSDNNREKLISRATTLYDGNAKREIPESTRTEKTTELKDDIAPYWSEQHNGVVIPLLNKVLDAKNLSKKPQNWLKNKELAEQAGKEWMTREDFHILYWQRNEINAILAEHEGDLLEGWFASSSECSNYHHWIVDFGSGNCYSTGKGYSDVARGLVVL